MPDLSVIIAASRTEPLERCLSALAQQDVAATLEVLVVLSPHMIPPAAPSGLTVRWLRSKCAHPAAMRNEAAAIADAPLLAFLDDDAAPLSGWGRTVLELADPQGRDILVGPNRDRRRSWRYRLAQAVQENPLLEGLSSHRRVSGQPRHVSVHDAPLCNLIVPRALFRELGGLNTAVTYYFDDVDFNQRARAAGARHLMYPGLAVQHDVRPLIYPYLAYKFRTRYMIGRHLQGCRHLYADSRQLKLVHASWVMLPVLIAVGGYWPTLAVSILALYAVAATVSYGSRLKEPMVAFLGPPMLFCSHVASWLGYTLGRLVGGLKGADVPDVGENGICR